jgi:hypothetical protein
MSRVPTVQFEKRKEGILTEERKKRTEVHILMMQSNVAVLVQK